MQLDEFNAMTGGAAAAAVRPCVDIDSWVTAIVAGRPYADVGSLLDLADAQARGWTSVEVEQALADHPRIGERHAGSGASAAMSGREQGGVSTTDEVQERLRAGNAAYEARFDRIYLVRAAGRTAEEILALLDERLGNDPETEIRVTAGQLREITLLRLEGLFS